MTWSTDASGNLRGSLVVSISNARTIQSGLSIKSSLLVMVGCSLLPLQTTSYQLPTKMLLSMLTLTWRGRSCSRMSTKCSMGFVLTPTLFCCCSISLYAVAAFALSLFFLTAVFNSLRTFCKSEVVKNVNFRNNCLIPTR